MVPVLHSNSSSGHTTGACFIEAPTPCSRSFLNTDETAPLSWKNRLSFLFIKFGASGIFERMCLHNPAKSWLTELGGYCYRLHGKPRQQTLRTICLTQRPAGFLVDQ